MNGFLQFQDVRFGGFCRYSRIEDLAFFKRPIKIEYINDSPRVVVVHDIVDKQLINHLQGYSDQVGNCLCYMKLYIYTTLL
jgi:hypothetical protein